MKETKLSLNQLEVISSNHGLEAYLSGLSVGRDATPRSALYNLVGKTELLEPDAILERWNKHLKRLESSGDQYDREIYQFEGNQLAKWGPQGRILPIEDLLDEIVYPSFSSGRKPSGFDSEHWRQAKRLVVRCLHKSGCVGLAPVPFTRVVDDMRARDTLESNSGWPYFTKRHNPRIIQRAIEEAKNGEWRTYPAISLFRNYNNKTRLVWMYPMSANLVEGSFFQPLQERLVAGPYSFFAPWRSFDACRQLIGDAYKENRFVAASDFTSTDEHFKLAATLEVFDVLKYCFQPRYRDALKESMSWVNQIPLIIGKESMLVGEHGVSSGSNWTNFIETVFDWILSAYVCLDSGRTSYVGLYAIGDDMTWSSPRFEREFAERLEKLAESVGMVVKAEKTTNTIGWVKSLQRLFQKGYYRPDGALRAVYPTIRALKSLVYPERYHKSEKDGGYWTKDMDAVRTFMILENCIDHPLFEEFCKFVADGDPNLKVVSRMRAAQQTQLTRTSKLIPGLAPTYNQEKRDQDLAHFASVQFIKNLD